MMGQRFYATSKCMDFVELSVSFFNIQYYYKREIEVVCGLRVFCSKSKLKASNQVPHHLMALADPTSSNKIHEK
jgi:hypothetical protein